MTTLAIIGSGIVGRSLIYTLAKEKKSFSKIVLFSSESFSFPCSYHSTAVVAPRGVTPGHSFLGDELYNAFQEFSSHVGEDLPRGVEKISQFTAEPRDPEKFLKRYPHGGMQKLFLKENTLLASDQAFLIDPRTYLDFLLQSAREFYQEVLDERDDFVTEIHNDHSVKIKTHKGEEFSFDKVVLATGHFNRFFQELFPESVLKTSRPVQGSYLEFNELNWKEDSFSLTYDGKNLIWHKPLGRLLIGSASHESPLELPNEWELRVLYEFFKERIELELPDFSQGSIKVGMREKAQKRWPFVLKNKNLFALGGMYKNGYSLALRTTRTFSHQNL